MKTTEEHYANLLGLAAPWKVSEVELNVSALQVKIFVCTVKTRQCAQSVEQFVSCMIVLLNARGGIWIPCNLKRSPQREEDLNSAVCFLRCFFITPIPLIYGAI